MIGSMPSGIDLFDGFIACLHPLAELLLRCGRVIGILHGMLVGAQELLGGAAGHVPAGDVLVPAAVHNPLLERMEHFLRVGQPFFRGKGLMQRRALRVAADFVRVGAVPPGGRFNHQSGNEVNLARLAVAHHAAEILVGVGEIILVIAFPEARTERTRAGVGVDAAVACVHGAEEQFNARFLEILIPGLFGLIGHVTVQRHLFAAFDLQQIQFAVFDDPTFHG